jgi:hypothetical protein
MKKTILLSATLYLFALVVQAQTESKAFKDCLVKAIYAEGEWMQDAQNPYPSVWGNGHSSKLNAATNAKLFELRKILFEAYPKPKATHCRYDMWYGRKMKSVKAPEALIFHTMFCPLKCKEDGTIDKKFNTAMESYGIAFHINTIDIFGQLFPRVDDLSKAIDTTKVKNFRNVFLVPPRNNFDEVNASRSKVAAIKKEEFGNAIDKYFVYRNINDGYARPSANYTDVYEETVVLTYNGKFPYIALSRNEFFGILAMYLESEKTKYSGFITDYEKRKPEYYEENVVGFKKSIATAEKKYEGIKKLRDYFKDELEKPAIVSSYYKNYSFLVNDAVDNFEQAKKCFTDDAKKGYTYAKLDKTFFKSNKAEDWQIITAVWYTWKFAGSHPDNNIKEDKLPNITYGVTDAMENKMDWNKLASLLMK